MEIRWSPEAAEDLEHIVDRIRRDNPDAARQVAEIIYSRCASLENFPDRGRIGRIPGTRAADYLALLALLGPRGVRRIDEVIACRGALWDRLL